MALLTILLTVLVLGSLSAYYFVFSSSKQLSKSCSPSSSVLSVTKSGQEDSLLFEFPVTCLRITNSTNGSIILNGFIYVAENQQEQQQGFMNVTSFGNCNGFAVGSEGCVGMLFNFTIPEDQCFWMENTEIPLQQDWIAANGTVLFIYQASPETETTICHFAQYVLETSPAAPITLGSVVSFGENSTG